MAATLVQSNKGVASGSGTTVGVSLASIAAASAMALVASYDITGGDNTDSIADDLSVAATRITGAGTSAGGFNQRVQGYYYKNYGGGSRTFTLTNSVAETGRAIIAAECAGVDTVSPLDGVITNTGSTLTETSGNVSPAPSVNGCIIFGAGNLNTGSTVNAPFADVQVDTASSFTWVSFLQQAAAAGVAATWTQGSALAYQAVAFVLKPAPTTGGQWSGRGTRQAPGQHGPFDPLGFLLSPFQRYSFAPSVAATTLQRKTLSPLGTHTGGRQSQ